MRIHAPAALFLHALLTWGCAGQKCPELGVAMGVASTRATLWRISIFPPTARCENGRAIDAAPTRVVDYSPTAQATLDLPAGPVVVQLEAFGGAASSVLVGVGCSAVTIADGQRNCLALAVTPTDAGAGITGDGPPTDGPPGSPDLSCPQHSTGLGQSFASRCVPLGTYDQQLAFDACAAYQKAGHAGKCEDNPCSGGNMGASVCLKGSDCTCWTYSGAGQGHVRANVGGGGCECATVADASWQ